MTTQQIIFRILLAIFIGGFIGYEREMRNRPAGFITHILVCVGATVVSLIQVQIVENTTDLLLHHPELGVALKADYGRVIAQVITGVGFLGAGTIILDKGSIKGLTTATTIWLVACLGLAIGLGFYKIAFVATIGVIFIIVVLKRFEKRVINNQYTISLNLVYKDQRGIFLEEITEFLNKTGVSVKNIRVEDSFHKEYKSVRLDLYFGLFRNQEKIIKRLAKKKEVIEVSIAK